MMTCLRHFHSTTLSIHGSRRHTVILDQIFTYCSVLRNLRLPMPEYLHLSLLIWILFGPRKVPPAEPRSHVNIFLVSWREEPPSKRNITSHLSSDLFSFPYRGILLKSLLFLRIYKTPLKRHTHTHIYIYCCLSIASLEPTMADAPPPPGPPPSRTPGLPRGWISKTHPQYPDTL